MLFFFLSARDGEKKLILEFQSPENCGKMLPSVRAAAATFMSSSTFPRKIGPKGSSDMKKWREVHDMKTPR